MGKLQGLIQFTGQLDGLSFYTLNGTIVVRKTGGFNGKKIKQDPNFVRVRENGSEFGHCSRLGRYFRNSFSSYLKPLQIPYVHNRVVRLFKEISVLDTIHPRGQRTVWSGLQSEDAPRIIAAFEFDNDRSFSTLFPFDLRLNLDEGRLTVMHFNAAHLPPVKGATHVQLQYVQVGLDFEQQLPSIQHCSALQTLSLDDSTPMDLEFSSLVPASPQVFGLLSVRFYQHLSGVDYPLQVGGLKIVGCR